MTWPVQEDLPLEVPTSLPPVEPTGDPRVDAALDRLAELDGAPVPEHVEVFSDIHVRLTGALADLGDGVPGGADETPEVAERDGSADLTASPLDDLA
ncbi:MAG: hypothetical protein ACKOT0_07735 [bacterium]